jgi:hypothetical protein
VFYVAFAMLVVLVIAALVVVYVAYPHRGQEVPRASWLGDAMTRAVEAAPLLTPDEEHDPARAR